MKKVNMKYSMDNPPFKEVSTSKEALDVRLKTNKNAEKDFDEWALNLLPKLYFKANILDLGCGMGKQANLFAEFLGRDTNIFALDVSKESLNAFGKAYCALPKLKLINDSFENFPTYINSTKEFFDLIYSFYALYYASDLEKVISLAYRYLKTNGILWVVAPYRGTNKEVFDIIRKFYSIDQSVSYSIEIFYKDIVILSEKFGFRNIKINQLKNKIHFMNKEEVLKYLRNTTFYNKKYEGEIIEELKKRFQASKVFTLSKNAISIMMEK